MNRARRQWGPRERAVGVFALLALGVWMIGAFWIGSRMYAEHNPHRADWKCEKPVGVFGTSSWSNWPPGRVCHYADGTLSRPSDARSVVIIVLGATAVIALVFALLSARRRFGTRPLTAGGA